MEFWNSSVGAVVLGAVPLAVFAVFWFGIISHLVRKSGLRTLQADYSLQGKVGRDFKRLRVRSGRMGQVRFNGMLRLDLNPHFLVVRFKRPFAFVFSGVQIPLSEVRYEGVRGKWIFKYHHFTLSGHSIDIYGKAEPLIRRLEAQPSTPITGQE